MCCSSAEASPTLRAPSCNSTPHAGGTPPGRSWIHSTALKSRLSRALTEAQPTSPTDSSPSLDADDCNDLRKATLRRMLMLRAGESDLLPEPQQLHHQLQGPHGHGHGRTDRSLRRSSRMAQQAETPRDEGRDCMCVSPSPAAPHLQPLC